MEKLESALLNFPKFDIKKFSDVDSERWNSLVKSSINGTFLHSRDFISHHKDRFQDHSLMITNEHGDLVAILPLVIEGEIGISHPGLTYGGLIHLGLNANDAIGVMAAICGYLRKNGILKLTYRAVPYIYHKDRCDEDLYALWYLGGVLTSRAASSVITPRNFRPRKNRRVRGLRNSIKHNVTVQYESISDSFWSILKQNLEERYEKSPVHTLAEITELEEKFPENIRLLTARINDQIVAGVIVFDTGEVLHLQYIASNSIGRSTNALDALIEFLTTSSQKKIIDFGISTESNGKTINEGLHQFKSEFGAGVVNYESYELTTSNFLASL